MIQIDFSDEIKGAAPGLRVIQIEATAGNGPTCDELWQEIEEAGRLTASRYELQQINKRPAIAGTRRAYKALGKDPNRYRPNLTFENNPYGEDQLFIWKALLHVDEVVHIKKPLYNYLHRPGSIMTASGVQKIIKAYPFFLDLQNLYQRSENAAPFVKKYLLPLWVRGILHSSAKIISYSEYKLVLVTFEANKHCTTLKSYPSIIVRTLSHSYFLSKRIFYLVNKFL